MALIKEAEDVYRLPLFTPFPVGPANAYVLMGDRLGLFDCGIGLERTWEELVAGLAQLGRRPADVDFVVVSHCHVDHQGLANRFPDAEVLCGRADLPAVQDVDHYASAHLAVVEKLFAQWGVSPAQTAELSRAADFSTWKGSVPSAQPVDDGQCLPGSDFRVLAMPGHTKGLICLHRSSDGLLLSSDHLLPRITSNPDLYTGDVPVRSGLRDYIASLRRLLTLDIGRVLPGHGKSFLFTREKVDAMLAHHTARLSEVREEAGTGSTIEQITHRLFGERDPLNHYFALRETFGHLEILVESGRVGRETAAVGAADLYRAERQRA